MNLPNPYKQIYTIGVQTLCRKTEGFGDLWAEVITEYKKQPDNKRDTGENDKSFFSFKFRNKKLWAVGNEVGGLTIMFPEEY